MIRTGDLRSHAEGVELVARPRGRHAAWREADSSWSRCTSSRVTWGGGECLDDAGELVTSCPRHQPATYARENARHRRVTPAELGARITASFQRLAAACQLPHTREDYTLS